MTENPQVGQVTEVGNLADQIAEAADLGPCIHGLCTSTVVGYITRTEGPSARLTVITGPRAEELAGLTDSPLSLVCVEHAHQALDDLLTKEPR